MTDLAETGRSDESRRSSPSSSPRSPTRRALLSAVLALTAVVWLTAGPGPARAQEAPRLDSMEIAVWPEFDQPATVLVILRGKLADDVPLPAALSLHIPTPSGGPYAVASASSVNETLLNLDYDLAPAEDSLLLTFTTPNPYLQIEFYEPLSIDASDRSYTYVWPGDLAVDEVNLEVQEPVGATNITTEPELRDGVTDPDRLVYRRDQIGAVEQGETLALSVSYLKSDLSTSRGPPSPEETGGTVPVGEPADDGFPVWVILVIALAVVVGVAAALGYWRWQTRAVAAPAEAGARSPGRDRRASRKGRGADAATFCPQCGEPLDAGDRFCRACGTAARGR